MKIIGEKIWFSVKIREETEKKREDEPPVQNKNSPAWPERKPPAIIGGRELLLGRRGDDAPGKKDDNQNQKSHP